MNAFINKPSSKQFGLFCSFFLAFLLIYAIYDYLNDTMLNDKPSAAVVSFVENKFNNKNLIMFDLNADLQPSNLYQKIPCRTSAIILNTDALLCTHDINKDTVVSRFIWNQGSWEPHMLSLFIQAVKSTNSKDSIVFDIGANIGQYTLFAAKMGWNVIAVEPFHDNILVIHKAARLENTQSKIKLFKMALSNERNQLKLLQPSDNIGGQWLNVGNETIDVNKIDENSKRYLVRTMLMDDLVDFLPDTQLNGVMKIDIEGFEPYALEKAKSLFDRVAFQYVFMEWEVLKLKVKENLVENTIAFLSSYDLKPFDHSNNQLNKADWKSWPWDVLWKK